MHRYEQISPSLNLLYLYFRKVFLSSQTDILMETCKLIARLGKFSKFPDKINIRDVLHEFFKGAERGSFFIFLPCSSDRDLQVRREEKLTTLCQSSCLKLLTAGPWLGTLEKLAASKL